MLLKKQIANGREIPQYYWNSLPYLADKKHDSEEQILSDPLYHSLHSYLGITTSVHLLPAGSFSRKLPNFRRIIDQGAKKWG